MKFSDIQEGLYYVLLKDPGTSHFVRLTGNKTLLAGDIIRCILTKKTSYSYYSASANQYTEHVLVRYGEDTDTTYKVTNHSCIMNTDNPEKLEDRALELKVLERNLIVWIKEIKTHQAAILVLEQQVEAGRTRQANLKSFESDTEALAHALQEQSSIEGVDMDKIVEILKNSGIQIN